MAFSYVKSSPYDKALVRQARSLIGNLEYLVGVGIDEYKSDWRKRLEELQVNLEAYQTYRGESDLYHLRRSVVANNAYMIALRERIGRSHHEEDYE